VVVGRESGNAVATAAYGEGQALASRELNTPPEDVGHAPAANAQAPVSLSWAPFKIDAASS